MFDLSTSLILLSVLLLTIYLLSDIRDDILRFLKPYLLRALESTGILTKEDYLRRVGLSEGALEELKEKKNSQQQQKKKKKQNVDGTDAAKEFSDGVVEEQDGKDTDAGADDAEEEEKKAGGNDDETNLDSHPSLSSLSSPQRSNSDASTMSHTSPNSTYGTPKSPSTILSPEQKEMAAVALPPPGTNSSSVTSSSSLLQVDPRKSHQPPSRRTLSIGGGSDVDMLGIPHSGSDPDNSASISRRDSLADEQAYHSSNSRPVSRPQSRTQKRTSGGVGGGVDNATSPMAGRQSSADTNLLTPQNGGGGGSNYTTPTSTQGQQQTRRPSITLPLTPRGSSQQPHQQLSSKPHPSFSSSTSASSSSPAGTATPILPPPMQLLPSSSGGSIHPPQHHTHASSSSSTLMTSILPLTADGMDPQTTTVTTTSSQHGAMDRDMTELSSTSVRHVNGGGGGGGGNGGAGSTIVNPHSSNTTASSTPLPLHLHQHQPSVVVPLIAGYPITSLTISRSLDGEISVEEYYSPRGEKIAWRRGNIWDSDFIYTFTQGLEFMKYGSWGSPHVRKLKFVLDPQTKQLKLDWGTGSILLDEVESIKAGKNTPVFSRYAKDTSCPDYSCFSILTPKRTLDLSILVTKTQRVQEKRDLLVFGLGEITGTRKGESKPPIVAANASSATPASSTTTPPSASTSPPILDMHTTPIPYQKIMEAILSKERVMLFNQSGAKGGGPGGVQLPQAALVQQYHPIAQQQPVIPPGSMLIGSRIQREEYSLSTRQSGNGANNGNTNASRNGHHSIPHTPSVSGMNYYSNAFPAGGSALPSPMPQQQQRGMGTPQTSTLLPASALSLHAQGGAGAGQQHAQLPPASLHQTVSRGSMLQQPPSSSSAAQQAQQRLIQYQSLPSTQQHPHTATMSNTSDSAPPPHLPPTTTTTRSAPSSNPSSQIHSDDE